MPFDHAEHTPGATAFHALGAQVAAIPIRFLDGAPQVLLVTTRGRRHWTTPKGWPLHDAASPACAAREAFEEAGVIGPVEPHSLGSYRYWKNTKNGRQVLQVTAFAMRVEQMLADWPERAQRKRVWFSLDAAAKLTGNDELNKLIRQAGQMRVAQPVLLGALN